VPYDLVATGHVAESGVLLADGSKVGVGDLVLTRLNQRDLHGDGGWVKNGDQWRITRVNPDGSLTVHRAGRTGTSTRLPADYVHEHLELGYATTAHRAQGRTVDTCHAYISAATLREPLYVMATRGRDTNQLYVDTSHDPDIDTAHQASVAVPVEVVLRGVLATSMAELSATQTKTAEAHAAASPTRSKPKARPSTITAERSGTSTCSTPRASPSKNSKWPSEATTYECYSRACKEPSSLDSMRRGDRSARTSCAEAPTAASPPSRRTGGMAEPS